MALRAPAHSLFRMPETLAPAVNDLVLASARIPGGTALYDVHVVDGVVSRLAPAGIAGNPAATGWWIWTAGTSSRGCGMSMST